MIPTTIYFVPDSGPVQVVAELPDCIGGAAHVWSALGSQFIPGQAWQTWGETEWHQLSSRLATDQMSFTEKAVFCATLDYAVIERRQFDQMSRALRQFAGRHPMPEASGQLESLADFLEDFECGTGIGVGLRHDMALTNPWCLYDPTEDGYRPYDTSSDCRHWNLFETLSTCINAACRHIDRQITLLERIAEQRQIISQHYLRHFIQPP